MSLTELAAIEQRLTPEGAALVAQAHAFVIVDAATMDQVAEHRRLCRAYRARVAEHLDPIRDAQHKAWKLTVAKIDELCAPALKAESIDGKKLAAWDDEQASIRLEAEAARQREIKRREALEAERVAAETARRRREAEDVRLAQAAAAEARGDLATAERLIEAPVDIAPVLPAPVFVPPVAAPEPARPAGTTYQTRWSAELLDFGALIDAVRSGAVSREVAFQVLAYNGPGANRLATSTRGALVVPGIRFASVKTTVQKGDGGGRPAQA